MIFGYIYIRSNKYWDIDNVYKLGQTGNIPDRTQTYITSELCKGHYKMVIEIPFYIKIDNKEESKEQFKKELLKLEKSLQTYFKKFHVQNDGGTEFYKKSILDEIEDYFIKNDIDFNILTEIEIEELTRKDRIQNPKDTEDTEDTEDTKDSEEIKEQEIPIKKPKEPKDYQLEIIETSIKYFKINDNDKGLLVIPCGVGKTLISLWTIQKLNSSSVIIGVPNKLLLKQWDSVINETFIEYKSLKVSSGVSVDNIIDFLKEKEYEEYEEEQEDCKKIIITTYSSSHKVLEACQKINFTFCMKINDETHHLTAFNLQLNDSSHKFIRMLEISSIKQISLTATLKNIIDPNIDNIISNDNEKYFGETIEKKCLLWAINKDIVCDYVIQTIIINEEQLKEKLEEFKINITNDKRLFLSAFSALKSIYENHSHHLLIYSNNKENSNKIIDYIEELLKKEYFVFDDNQLYYSSYNSEMKSKEQNEILKKFNGSKFGIITCVYCLGEGWDCPLLDGVLFSENMSSSIRIVQSALRASRKNEKEPNKKTKIILPILNKDDLLENDKDDFKKVREVIYQMGLEDETIIQKIKVFKIDIGINNGNSKKINKEYDFGELDEELTEKLKLNTVHRSSLGMTYSKAKKIINEKQFKIKSKDEYYKLCDKDVRLSKEPEKTFQDQFVNWIDYLSIERIYYDLEMCKNKITEYLLIYPELKKEYLNLSLIAVELSKKDDKFPPSDFWVDYYNVKDLRSIIEITNKKKKTSSSII